MITLRITIGFILILIAIDPLECTSLWRQTRQIHDGTRSETRTKSATNSSDNDTIDIRSDDDKDAAAASKQLAEKHFNELVLNETIKNDDGIGVIKKPKTETNAETSKVLLKPKEHYAKEHSLNKTSIDNERGVKKQDEETKKKEAKREEGSRSIDVDIDKFTSPEFHNKNNVYTLPVSPSIKKYVDNGYGDDAASTTTETMRYKHSRYANDYNLELTTPKSPYFDLKHREIEDGVQQNLDELHSHFGHKELEAKEVKENHPLVIDALLDKTNDTNVQLDYKTFKNIERNKTSDPSSSHEDVTTRQGTKLYFNETYNDTKIIDEQNVIPITGPDDLAKEKIGTERNLSRNVTSNEIASSTVINESATFRSEPEKKDKIKPVLPVTDKPTVNHLTKPPTPNKTSSLISNKIEVEQIKPIDELKVDRSPDDNRSTTVGQFPQETSAVEKDRNAQTTPTTVDLIANLTESSSLNPMTTDVDGVESTEPSTSIAVEATTEDVGVKNLTEPITTAITPTASMKSSTEQLPSTVNEVQTISLVEIEGKTEPIETSTIVLSTEESTATPTDFPIEATTTSWTLEVETTATNEMETATTGSTIPNDFTTSQYDSTTETTVTEEISTMTPFATASSDSIVTKTPLAEATNRTNEVLKERNSEERERNATKSSEGDFDDDDDDEYVDNSAKTTNDIVKETSSTMKPILDAANNISAGDDGRKIKATDVPIEDITTIVTSYDENITTSDNLELPKEDNDGKVIAIIISCVGAVCLIALVVLLIIMRKRQKRFNYGQRCTPVSLDDYSMDNVSVYNSVRRKGVLRVSKRSYGNPAFDDPSSLSNQLNFVSLVKFGDNVDDIRKEFDQIPQVTTRTTELPEGCDVKNRYANVIPLPETRVFLNLLENYPNSDYINANYVTGPKGVRNYYIACQAPMQNTVEDFWRMVWEQQSKVILMLTHIFENGTEKCFDYLPPSEVTDCQRLFGDLQITLKRREVKTKYIISTIQLKNMISNSWREVTHLWYIGWPEKGVPEEANSIITFLIEARSYLKIALNTGNNHYTLQPKDGPNGTGSGNNPSVSSSPMVIHCSPGTGRTGTVIACDIAIREFELTRQVDIPKIVYKIRRDRASSVQTRDQYVFIYKVICLYATKLTGGGLDSI